MRQTHTLPAILSMFIPGFGQMLKDEFSKGLMIFLGLLICLFSGILAMFVPFIWLWNIIDAYNYNKDIEQS